MAAELVGGALLSAFLQAAFDKLGSADILDFFHKRRLNETLLKKLKIVLLSINTVIDDAEQKQITNPNVKAWLDEVKDAVYGAEDVLDEIDYQVSKHRVESEVQTTATSKVRNLFSSSGSSFEMQVENQIIKVIENLEYLATQKDILVLKENGGGGGGGVGLRSLVSERLPTTSLVDEAGTYGRDDDKEIIINWLLSDNNDGSSLSVVSIVGMGGLGKTTLAQLVYNDQMVVDEFDLKAWACISEDFDVLRVTRTIIEAIGRSNDDAEDLNTLQIKLKEMLTGKRFLLVLDDIWNENYMQWEALQKPFKYGALGSKIIVTTRSNIVASTVRSSKIHPLKQLTEEDSWSLFRRYAFRDVNASHPKYDFEDIGRKIIKKCKGLPLALKAIGSLLYTKLSYEEWNGILRSEIWEEESNILPALKLSYHYLPSVLKRCFAFCSVFPKDYEFDKEHLIRLWMAESFLQCGHQSKDIREVGDQLFHDLLSRSFFQRSSEVETRFVMHDLVNDLAKEVFGNFLYRLEADQAKNVSKMTRHFSYLRYFYASSKRFEAIYQANRLRTFLPLSMQCRRHLINGRYCYFMSRKMISDLLSKLTCLRVLSLSGYVNIVELPDSIGNLKHLRYLDLSGTDIKKLPNSTCQLYHLQTLKLRFCRVLEKLPMDLHKLINLRHLDFRNTKVRVMPKKLWKLKKLQVLSSFYVGKCDETSIKQLEGLNIRGTLAIEKLQNVVDPMDASAVNLKDKIHLKEIMLGWSKNNDQSENERNVLERLQPHQNIESLSIENYGGTSFPFWLGDNTLSSLVSLELRNCKCCFFLPSLGLLASLKSLSIIGFGSVVAIGPEFYGNNSGSIPFRSLEFLKFQNMVGWEEWKFENETCVFPRLQVLHLENCPKLKEQLPTQLLSLRKLVIDTCKQLVASVPSIPNIHHLILSNCGKLQLDYLPSTVKVLSIRQQFSDCLREKIEYSIANTCLEKLYVSNCANLELTLHHCHNFLVQICIESSCNSLTTFPLDLFPKLQSLELRKCSNLEMISVSEQDHDLTSLTTLRIWNCPKFVSFPNGGFSASKLEFLFVGRLDCLKSLPEHLNTVFPSLKELSIFSSPLVESFPVGGLPSNLKTLKIIECPKLVASRMEWNLPSLQRLEIDGGNMLCFPEAGLLPPTLTSLNLSDCSSLKTLEYKGLCHLSTLKCLTLYRCTKLRCLPKEGLPNSLSSLEIIECPLLRKWCQKQKGKDWGRISHISNIRIDDDLLT